MNPKQLQYLEALQREPNKANQKHRDRLAKRSMLTGLLRNEEIFYELMTFKLILYNENGSRCPPRSVTTL